MNTSDIRISVVIPCYMVKDQVLNVISRIEDCVEVIYIVDDACPQNTGEFVNNNCNDNRIKLLRNNFNMGVGGAVVAGYRQAIADNMDVVVKIDGDNQMDPSILMKMVNPIIEKRADYVKGNRFFDPKMLTNMPFIRLLGNAALSFVNKLSSGYWNIMDPTNGYTAISVKVLKLLPLEKLDNRYFFESDMLFRLGTLSAAVQDIPMHSVYDDEDSNLSIINTALVFPIKYVRSFTKRIFYRYFLRDFNLGTLSLLTGTLLVSFAISYGCYMWYISIISGVPATSGTVMLSGLPAILGIQLILFFLNYDILNVPREALTPYLDY